MHAGQVGMIRSVCGRVHCSDPSLGELVLIMIGQRVDVSEDDHYDKVPSQHEPADESHELVGGQSVPHYNFLYS